MPRPTIDPIYLQEVRSAYLIASSSKERKRIIRQAQKASGYSYGGLMRTLKLKLRPRSLCPKEQERIGEMNVFARTVWEYQMNFSNGTRPVSTKLALRKLKDDGLIPEQVGYFQISQAIRRQHLKIKSDSYYTRFERSEPLASVQMDFTRSLHLEHVKKNGTSYFRVTKPKGANSKQERVWIGVAIDDASRVAYARYYLARGESSNLARNFLLRVCRRKQKADKQTGELRPIPLLQGQPKQLYTDRGSAFRNASFGNGLRKLDIEHAIGSSVTDTEGKKRKASNKQARGKVERFIQFIKQNFEARLLIEREGQLLTDKEINVLLMKWLVEVNTSLVPGSAQIRWEKFLPALEQAVFPPKEAELFFTNSVFRKVTRRQVRAADGVWCKVPPEVKPGATIEIIAIDENYYAMIEGERLLLEVITSKIKNNGSENSEPKVRNEFDNDYLEGMALRSRANEEIELRTRQNQNLGILSERFPEMMKEFFSLRRSIKDLKIFVTRLLLEVEKSAELSITPEGSIVSNAGSEEK